MSGKIKEIVFLGVKWLIFSTVTILSAGSCSTNKAELLYPPQLCDTITVTYTNTISPIISASCIGCHSGTTPAHGIDFSTYAVVKQHVDNGELWGAVSHAAGYPQMPKNSNKLSDCVLNKIKTWILAGAPNN
ncbi:MAG: hypothetical protein IPL84_04300 [Chitinophagaceae bacterium]|nr:hypothetical protein [Chitinophagaceae bacterium]